MGSKNVRRVAALGAIAVLGGVLAGVGSPASATAGPSLAVIVQEAPGAGDAPERAVEALGGEVGLELGLIDAFRADLPTAAVDDLAANPGVIAVTPDGQVTFASDTPAAGYGTFDAERAPGSLYNVARMVGADKRWEDGFTGTGIDVAVIDTGVSPVPGLEGQVIDGPDLSLDVSETGEGNGLDGYGHGTVIAGIIGGRDSGLPADPKNLRDAAKTSFVGVAPGSRVVDVKVGAADGSADVSQVIAAIDWVVQHRNTDGLNIRVLNLSFGTDGTQDYQLDPLTYAVEVAWRHGIVVVVSAGNEGYGSPKLNNPAYDPFVIAVGAADHDGSVGTKDDFIADFSSRGELARRPDFMAPGRSVVSLRVPGSSLDEAYPQARVGERFFRGSGTSHAAAVVSGAVALLLDEHPELTPDQVKALFGVTGRRLHTRKGEVLEEGARSINVDQARGKVHDLQDGKIPYAQDFAPATGLGLLDASRGSARLDDGETVLTGEMTVSGDAWDGQKWSADAFQGRTWSGGTWSGHKWSGGAWLGRTWSGRTWSGRTWSGHKWSASRWTGDDWTSA